MKKLGKEFNKMKLGNRIQLDETRKKNSTR